MKYKDVFLIEPFTVSSEYQEPTGRVMLDEISEVSHLPS